MRSRFIGIVVAGVIALSLWAVRAPTDSRAAYPAAEGFSFSQQCTSPTTVGATAFWTSYSAGDQWLDVSYYNNGWVPGTFVSIGPLPYYQTAFASDGLTPGTAYYVRVNTLVGGTWYPSDTATFFTLGDCSVQTVFVPIRVIVPVPPPGPRPPLPPPPPPIQPFPPPMVNPLPAP